MPPNFLQSLEAETGFPVATLGEFPVLATLKEFAPTEAIANGQLQRLLLQFLQRH